MFENDEDKIYFNKRVGQSQTEQISLGKILVGESNLLYYKFEDERNIFQKTDSWSINYTIFKYVDHIAYETRKFYYQIPVERATEFGQVLQFDGTEEKIYIPIRYWETRKTLIDPVELRRRNLIGDSWYEKLGIVLNSPYMGVLGNFIRERRKVCVVYPDETNVFRAYKLCSFEHTKVVFIGQDPYHDGSANGLSFGYKDISKKKSPKSLDIILKELERDVYNDLHLNFDYTLESWARQGVLLLNSSLTVEHGKPQSHSAIGWQRFVKITIYELLKDLHPKVYILWGTIAQQLFEEVVNKIQQQGISINTNLVLKAKHPASDLYSKDSFGNTAPNYPNTFAGCGHFSKINEFLRINKRKEIIW